ncbi:MAG: hypothetical protein HOP24_09085 [Sideroxydans sp.]|nr:hypothetical protein [Sideroxydans sp.]
MPIREFSSTGVPRAKIGFYNELPPMSDLERFKERKYACIPCTKEELQDPAFVALLDAVVFSQKPDKRSALGPILQASISLLLNNDVRVYVRIAKDPDGSNVARKLVIDSLLDLNVPLANIRRDEWDRIPEKWREREGSNLAPYIYIFDCTESWASIAHTVCDRPAGHAANTELRFDGHDIQSLGQEGHDERQILLQRAFSNCHTLHLEKMTDGLSGAPVFKAYASQHPVVGGWEYDWPSLHLVKLGPRKKIVDEYDKYIGHALDYVPFHLGPKLRLDRCNLGSSQGILVSDFVEGTEAIRDCAPAGRGGHAIANLFDKTLGAWRKQAKVNSYRTLGQFLDGKWLKEDKQEISVPPERAKIVSHLGYAPDVAPLREIFNRCSQNSVLTGPAHGDLHATNVLVRNGDAIIIDFEKMEDEFPMLYDPASLEGGLLVEGFGGDKRSTEDPRNLLESISPLYTLDILNNFVVPCHATNPSSWFYDCAGQIRTLSRHAELCDGQYALVLALCLIRKGCNSHSFDNLAYENLRAISFILGQKILTQVDQHFNQQATAIRM